MTKYSAQPSDSDKDAYCVIGEDPDGSTWTVYNKLPYPKAAEIADNLNAADALGAEQ